MSNCYCHPGRAGGSPLPLAQTDQRPEIEKKCLEALRKAAEIGTMDPDDVNREISMTQVETLLPGNVLLPLSVQGDLYHLVQSGEDETKLAIKELLPRLSANFRRE
jgi:hypothetical protein